MTEINRETVVSLIDEVESLFLDHQLSSSERLLTCANLILQVACKHVPVELSNEASDVVHSGKRLSYEIMDHADSIGLQVAVKAHLLIDLALKLEEAT